MHGPPPLARRLDTELTTLAGSIVGISKRPTKWTPCKRVAGLKLSQRLQNKQIHAMLQQAKPKFKPKLTNRAINRLRSTSLKTLLFQKTCHQKSPFNKAKRARMHNNKRQFRPKMNELFMHSRNDACLLSSFVPRKHESWTSGDSEGQGLLPSQRFPSFL